MSSTPVCVEEHRRTYICGVPGNYAVKSPGNNRILETGFTTLEEAREWIMRYRP